MKRRTYEYSLRVFENRLLRKISGPKNEDVKEVGENYILKSFITCTLSQV
jgi:hypothetical protein